MAKSPLFGRRIHIAGSINRGSAIAATADVDQARELVAGLVAELVKRGAKSSFPSMRRNCGPAMTADLLDWLVWQDVQDNLASPRMSGPARRWRSSTTRARSRFRRNLKDSGMNCAAPTSSRSKTSRTGI